MSEDTPLDDTNVIDPTPADAQSAPEQDATPTPDSEDAAKSTEESQDGSDKEPSRAEKRIQQLVGDRNHALEFGKLQQERAADLQRQLETRNAPAETAAPVMPKLEDFDYDQDAFDVSKQNYDDWHIDRKVNARVAEAMKQSGQTAEATKVDADWQSRANEFANEHPDFVTLVGNPAFKQTPKMAETIKKAKKGPDLAYHLAQHLDVVEEISQLSPDDQVFRLAEITAELSSKPAVAQKQVTNAADPMSPVGGGQPTLNTSNETIDDFMKRRNVEAAEARKSRGTGRV